MRYLRLPFALPIASTGGARLARPGRLRAANWPTTPCLLREVNS
jgi:hypothetical protein